MIAFGPIAGVAEPHPPQKRPDRLGRAVGAKPVLAVFEDVTGKRGSCMTWCRGIGTLSNREVSSKPIRGVAC